MGKALVIVESPAKAKTIKKYLGKDYQVMASYGHLCDLIPKEGAVDTENDFKMHYQLIEKNASHYAAIKKALKSCDTLLLAPDPDREGEAIAWHLVQLLKDQGALKNKSYSRIVFNQITKRAVQEAAANPRDIAMNLVHAQQARRALDYLVGFTLSPLLWKKIRRGLSAGRVQSPALRLIAERELEIEKFDAKEYWSIEAHAQTKNKPTDLSARLIKHDNEKLEQFSITDEKKAQHVHDTIVKAANGELTVASVTKKERKRKPTAPFTTSTLQQEAARKLGFTAQRTMRIAQQLYEGIDTGEGSSGLITYMRTDSVTLAQEALTEIRNTIEQLYGKENLPADIRTYKTKSKNAQEAHEAIRPTDASQRPESLTTHLSKEQLKLYALIWKRTIACQMIDATLNTVSIDLTVKTSTFRTNGSTIKHPGFLAVYSEGTDDKKQEDDQKILPPLEEGDTLTLLNVIPKQHFTEPPPRFSEASLVKALEEHGIGRPSTYASIISTLQSREYVILDSKRFKPTDVGRIVNHFLTKYFSQYVDYDFTAHLEDTLDAISHGTQEWIPVLKEFWTPFKSQIDEIESTVQRSDVTQEALDENCPECSKPLSIRLGKRGRFIGCTAYPDCSYTRNLVDEQDQELIEQLKKRACPECQSELLIRHGKYGKFIGCSNYPDCRHLEPLDKPTDTEVTCPECNQATIYERKSRRGKVFFSCNRYPDCKYALWNKPVKEACPTCQWPILTVKTTKKRGTEKTCPQQNCKYSLPFPEGAPDSE